MFRLDRPCIVLQSDDWGFCAWTAYEIGWRLAEPFAHDDRARRYLGSTLESPESLQRVFDVLASFSGGDGLPALLQANYVLCAPDYVRIAENGYHHWFGIELPDVPPRWQRGDLITAARQGIARGVWHAEYHGYTHCSVPILLQWLQARDAATLDLFSRQSWPLHDPRVYSEYEDPLRLGDVSRGLALFAELFGYVARSTCPPNYRFSPRLEPILRQHGIAVLQGVNRFSSSRPRSRWQRIRRRLWPTMPAGMRQLDRHIDFEPRGEVASDAERPHWRQVFDEVASELRRNRAAIVSTHRLNFIHLDTRWVDAGLEQLRLLLAAIAVRFPEAIYVTDWEYAQLSSRGVSGCATAERLVVRNLTGRPARLSVSLPTTWPDNRERWRQLPAGLSLERLERNDATFLAMPGSHVMLAEQSPRATGAPIDQPW